MVTKEDISEVMREIVKKRWKKTSPEERRANAFRLNQAQWGNMTTEERKEEMRRRMAKRKKS